jgi:predicted amidohydrolase
MRLIKFDKASACSACGTPADGRAELTGGQEPIPGEELACTCTTCGHLMMIAADGTRRDLTRTEAAEYAADPERLAYIRADAEDVIRERQMWG